MNTDEILTAWAELLTRFASEAGALMDEGGYKDMPVGLPVKISCGINGVADAAEAVLAALTP